MWTFCFYHSMILKCKYKTIQYNTTFTAIRPEAVNIVLEALNKFHRNISFTYELEKDGRITFLDVLIIRDVNKIETTIYRKPTNNNIYMHWTSFTPKVWRRGTLQNLLLRAYKFAQINNSKIKQSWVPKKTPCYNMSYKFTTKSLRTIQQSNSHKLQVYNYISNNSSAIKQLWVPKKDISTTLIIKLQLSLNNSSTIKQS